MSNQIIEFVSDCSKHSDMQEIPQEQFVRLIEESDIVVHELRIRKFSAHAYVWSLLKVLVGKENLKKFERKKSDNNPSVCIGLKMDIAAGKFSYYSNAKLMS